jgi:hypothetical protein
MGRLGQNRGHFLQVGTQTGRKLGLHRVDHVLLERRIDFGEGHRGWGGTHGRNGFDPYRSARRTHAVAVEVRRHVHFILGPQVPFALPPVERENLVARSVMQLLHPGLELVRDNDLADAVIARGEVGRTEHAEFVDECRQAPAIHDHGNRRTGTGLFQHVLIGAELGIGEQLDFERPVRCRRDIVAEGFEPLVERVRSGQCGVDAQCIVGRQDRRGQRDDKASSKSRGKRYKFHNSSHAALAAASRSDYAAAIKMVVW